VGTVLAYAARVVAQHSNLGATGRNMSEHCATLEQAGWVMRVGRVSTSPESLVSAKAFGYAALVLFLFTQAADGLFTYLGVGLHGVHAEANPLAARMMEVFGLGPTVTGIKVLTSGMGFALYALGVPRILAIVAGIYFVTAVVPWATLLMVW
jgi:hypothetical protein